jgi:DNA-binding CsgD family transcriptional regulator
MTGLAETEHIVRGLEAGGVDYVTKPIVIEEMLARIRVHLANARLTQSAHAALDVSGRFLLAVDRSGHILWATPQAQKLLDRSDTTDISKLFATSDSWSDWLAEAQGGKTIATSPSVASPPHGDDFRIQFMGRLGDNELLLRLNRDTAPELSSALSKTFGLTNREGEVLSWLSKGKTNRDIAQILGLSPRTVDKHLEQIYAKLGVDNRTAAAALAGKLLQARH